MACPRLAGSVKLAANLPYEIGKSRETAGRPLFRLLNPTRNSGLVMACPRLAGSVKLAANLPYEIGKLFFC